MIKKPMKRYSLLMVIGNMQNKFSATNSTRMVVMKKTDELGSIG
jgi:hypothetical protein